MYNKSYIGICNFLTNLYYVIPYNEIIEFITSDLIDLFPISENKIEFEEFLNNLSDDFPAELKINLDRKHTFTFRPKLLDNPILIRNKELNYVSIYLSIYLPKIEQVTFGIILFNKDGERIKVGDNINDMFESIYYNESKSKCETIISFRIINVTDAENAEVVILR